MLNYLTSYLVKQQAAGWKDDCFPPIIVEAPSRVKGEFPWRAFLEEILEKLGEINVDSALDLDETEKGKANGQFHEASRRSPNWSGKVPFVTRIQNHFGFCHEPPCAATGFPAGGALNLIRSVAPHAYY